MIGGQKLTGSAMLVNQIKKLMACSRYVEVTFKTLVGAGVFSVGDPASVYKKNLHFFALQNGWQFLTARDRAGIQVVRFREVKA